MKDANTNFSYRHITWWEHVRLNVCFCVSEENENILMIYNKRYNKEKKKACSKVLVNLLQIYLAKGIKPFLMSAFAIMDLSGFLGTQLYFNFTYSYMTDFIITTHILSYRIHIDSETCPKITLPQWYNNDND